MRTSVYLNIDEDVLKKLRQTKKEQGIPISRQLELAWLKIHGVEKQ